tara:strand:- start:4509 stop:5366 length:858 start_codon:yes stop_codon:yes gene_type:complete
MGTRARFNIVLPTLGGQGVWTDQATRSGWRVQVHALTGHARLLDRTNRRRAWGSRAAVETVFQRHAPSPLSRPHHVVVLVHGLGGNSLTFRSMHKLLRADGHVVAEFRYASALTQISDQADALRHFVDGLEADSITLVGQSMGGLVAERALAQGIFRNGAFGLGGTRIRGIVRIGTPCNGSGFARRIVADIGAARLTRTPLAEVATGLPQNAIGDLIAHLNIAGSLNGARGLNPWITGPDDGLVGVSEVTRWDSSHTIIINASHYGLTSNAVALRAVQSFLRNAT